MSFSTIQLPSGTAVTKLVNIPTCGAWLGGVVISICSSSSITGITWQVLNPYVVSGSTHYTGYRKLGSASGSTTNWSLSADTRLYRILFQRETMVKILYTCSSDVSLCIETTRSDWEPNPYPSSQGSLPNPGDGTITWVAQ